MSGPLLVEVEDLERGTRALAAFARSPVRIGRSELNDLRLEAPYVSGWHAVLQFDGDGVRVVDLGSTNGTWLDGAQLARRVPTPVRPSSDLRIGALRLALSRGAGAACGPAPRPETRFTRATAGAARAGPPSAPAPRAMGAGAGGAGEGRDATGPLLRAFAASYLPEAAPLEGGGAAARAFLAALAELVEAAAGAYLELRQGYEEFGREIGVRVPQPEGPLGRLREAGPLLAYLLDPAAAEPRARELATAFGDLMLHQVALLAGVTEGGKELLARLSPEAIAAEAERRGAADPGARVARAVRPLREAAQWRAYVVRHGALGEAAALHDALFGKTFAQAYAAVAGRGQGADPENGRGGGTP